MNMDSRLGNLSFPGIHPNMLSAPNGYRSTLEVPLASRPLRDRLREEDEKEAAERSARLKEERQKWVREQRASRPYLGPSDVRNAAKELGVSPMKLLRSVATFYVVNPFRGRRLITDLANQFSPGMASRGDQAFEELSSRVAW